MLNPQKDFLHRDLVQVISNFICNQLYLKSLIISILGRPLQSIYKHKEVDEINNQYIRNLGQSLFEAVLYLKAF